MRHVVRTALITAGLVGALTMPVVAHASTRWVRVTPTSGGITEEASAVRTPDGVLHVVWAPATAGGQLLHTTVSAGGASGTVTPVATGWAAIGNPAIARAAGGGLVIVAGAQRSTNTLDAIQNQALWSSADGGATWNLNPTDIAYGSGAADPLSLAFGPDGSTPFTAWATSGGVFVHRGTNPAVPNVNLQSACCGYDPGIAYDPVTNRLVVAWYSNATGQTGLVAQAIDSASGAPAGSRLLLPGSSSIPVGERTEIAARPGGGLYLADAGGASSATRARVWRFGDTGSTTVGSSPSGVSEVGVAADPQGRLWAFWTSGNGGSVLHARRSNPSVSRWGAEVIMQPPPGFAGTWKLDGNAQPGKLDLLGLFTVSGAVSTWDAQVLPGLSLAARAQRAGRLAVTVTDAGQAVPGATVQAGGRSAKTNKSGVARLRIGGHRPRAVTVTASKAGYTGASGRVRLPR